MPCLTAHCTKADPLCLISLRTCLCFRHRYSLYTLSSLSHTLPPSLSLSLSSLSLHPHKTPLPTPCTTQTHIHSFLFFSFYPKRQLSLSPSTFSHIFQSHVKPILSCFSSFLRPMPSDACDTPRPSKPQAPPPEQEHLPCPRCDSTNTKFCYYNNYNFSQPRHFCKSCRRYWTHGGTLRDIPVGGGSRKNAKRSRTTASAASSSVTAVSSASTHQDHPLPTTPVFVPISANQGGSMPFGGTGGVDNDVKSAMGMCGSFTSLLNNTAQGPGFLALGGFGLGLGHGFEEMGFGSGRTGWAFPGMVDGSNISGGVGGASGVGNSWQLENGEGGFVGGGDCFSWPGLAISTPGNGLK